MNKGFWSDLKLPIVGLSPMDGVTDAPMRFIAKKYGLPDVIYTEFVSVEGLWRVQKRGDTESKIWRDLRFDSLEQPVVVQLFGSDPDSFFETAKIVSRMGFAGIDINMGCPSPGLEKRGGGAGLMRDFGLAKEVVRATREGAGGLPVSVKTRVGSAKPDLDWWKTLAEMELPVVAMHGRTFKQLYRGEADWGVLLGAARVIKESGALFLGNGDIQQYADFRAYENTMDGVLIGRAAIGNPWVLRKDGFSPEIEERLAVMVEHARVFEKGVPEGRFEPMRKHLSWYARGFDGAGEMRRKLVQASNALEVEGIVNNFRKNC